MGHLGGEIGKPFIVIALATLFGMTASVHAHDEGVRRIAVVSAFAPERDALESDMDVQSVEVINGVEFLLGTLEGKDVVLFLSGISVVNAAMTMQLALDRFMIDSVIFSGIAGGVDPSLDIGDVVIADRWGQYLEVLFARQAGGEWETIPFFEYPYANFGMMFPRALTVTRKGSTEPETRFWFPVDSGLFEAVGRATAEIALENCVDSDHCLEDAPEIILGGPGVSGGGFVDNAAFRDYAFETFGARVLDMESAAVAHVAWSNTVPFIAIRSLSDLAGGSDQANQMETFFGLAAQNAATIVKALLREMPDG